MQLENNHLSFIIMLRVRVVISGFVQGVGFRYFLKEKADELGVTGWVRNTPEGDVEAIFEGEEAAVSQMVEAGREGPPPAQVRNVKVTKSKASGEFTQFTIRYL